MTERNYENGAEEVIRKDDAYRMVNGVGLSPERLKGICGVYNPMHVVILRAEEHRRHERLRQLDRARWAASRSGAPKEVLKRLEQALIRISQEIVLLARAAEYVQGVR